MLDGEYWIDDSGDLMYADGDIGDYNHESYVIDLMRSRLTDNFSINVNIEFEDWDEIKTKIVTDILEDEGYDEDKIDDFFEKTNDLDPIITKYLTNQGEKNAEEIVDIANGNGDPRMYAIEHWGWKRVAGNNIETWTLTYNDMDIIASGIDEILQQEGIDDDVSDDDIDLYISTYSGPSRDMTLAELKNKGIKLQSKDVEYDRLSKAATLQGRQQDITSLHPYYQKRTFPLGDSVKLPSFNLWLESKTAEELFGIEKVNSKIPESSLDKDDKPIKQFDFELFSDLLRMKTVGLFEGNKTFTNDVQWGSQPGCLKVVTEPDMHVAVKRLAIDLNGNHRWLSKRLYQIRKNGYGGYEDIVANEIYGVLQDINKQQLDVADNEFDNMENLAKFVTNKVRRVIPPLLIFREMKKLSRDNYITAFELRGAGVETTSQRRVEQIELEFAYDRDNGVLRIITRKIESPVGGPREWKLKPSDMDSVFFPSQDLNEIAEIAAVHFKYSYMWNTESFTKKQNY